MSVALQLDACEYRRREPQQDLLHRVLATHLEAFLDRARTQYHELPKYIENELRDYVKCGVLAYGFLRIRCNDCGKSIVIGFFLDGTNEDSNPPILKPARPMIANGRWIL